MPRRLGDVLLEWGTVTQDELAAALARQREDPTHRRLGHLLVEHGELDEKTLAAALAATHNLQSVDLDAVEIDRNLARKVPRTIAERHLVLPISQDNEVITVAVGDPVDVVALDEVRSRLSCDRVNIVVAPESQIRHRLAGIWGDAVSRQVVEKFVEDLPVDTKQQEGDDPDAGAVAVVNQILSSAAHREASDIHIEPLIDGVRVRIRVDGVLQELLRLPRAGLGSLVARLKIVSGLDVMQRRVPQDGRTTLRIGRQNRDIRVSTLPSIHGETIVLRLLPTHSDLPSLDALGMTKGQIELLRETLNRPQGLVLVTGPTGSGKSITLHASLEEVRDDKRNIISLEDPVEVDMPGLTQVPINDAIGMTFPTGLQAALRQDPDVIMVGESRDLETAQMAVRAALTGHLVLTTLHTLDAPSALTRLMEMGIPTYLVTASLRLIIAQRLLRRPCPKCAKPHVPDDDTCARLGLAPEQAKRMVRGEGCRQCDKTGFKGRIGVYSFLNVGERVRQNLLDGVSEPEMLATARAAGWQTLAERAVEMAMEGLTTPSEILRTIVTEYDPRPTVSEP
ncbi:MAG: GspE/PulE family protein [Candidatus Nanopelagicales bacterium]|nr:GspE/PulE family protein [Candidatus Nanopelagicales bacterium]MDZ4249487.1 GspE/PulE family protein [Candidatus Nanopelagicales bacterium]